MQEPKFFDRVQTPWTAQCRNMAKNDPMSQRMVRLREAMGHRTSKGFARYLGVEPTRWNNVENGVPLSRQLANIILKKCPGVTLDWLYNNDPSGLTVNMAQRLGAFGEVRKGTNEAS